MALCGIGAHEVAAISHKAQYAMAVEVRRDQEKSARPKRALKIGPSIPKTDELKVFEVQPGVAQLYVPITFMIAPLGHTAQPARFLMNQILVKTPEGWKVSSVLPIPVLMQ
jgi:hypothetical protein